MAKHQVKFRFYPPLRSSNPPTQRFMFTTGFECSYPTIETSQGRVRREW
jgi:hypothetical protein